MSILSRTHSIGFAVATAMAFTGAPARAQVVHVRLVDEETHQPLAGVLVSALNASGALGPVVLASGDGIATVRLAGSGPNRLLIRRIGFAPVTTEALALPADLATTLDIVVPAHRITLGIVHVVGSAACAGQTESPSALAQAAWTEVRTALEASALTRDQRLVTTTALRFQRDLRLDGQVSFADTTLRGRSGERPFVAPAPSVLERDGYFRQHDDGSEDFYAPDEYSLLSDGFTRRHCVSVLPDVRHDSSGTQIALAFVPRDRDTRPEIKGLVWLDSATSELRRIDFEYMRISLKAPADSIGGSVAFRHLASGAWIVSAWVLRMPRFRTVDRRRGYSVLDGYTEVGGSAVVTRDISTPGPNVPRSIVGSVFDSIAQRPLNGARIHLADLGREAVADSFGRFRFDSVGAAVHTLWADHPTLDALGLFSLGARVDATPEVNNNVALAIPSFATLWKRACGAGPVPSSEEGFVFGRVLSGASSMRAYGSSLEVSWPARTGDGARAAVQAQADSTGDFALCGVPVRRTVTLSTSGADSSTVPVSFQLGAGRIARRDLSFPPKSAIDSLIGDTSRVALARPADGATLSGSVHDATGRPVRDARVSLSGVTSERRADALGAFTVRGIPAGTRVLAVSATGYVRAQRLVTLAVDDSAYVALTLAGGIASGAPHKLKVVSATGQPVVYANVSIEGGTTQITDEKGEVALGAGNTQALTLSVKRIGFTPWFGSIDFRDTSSVFTVALTHVAQQLGEVRVTGQKNPSSPFVQGFYDRWLERQKGLLSATFIGPEELEFRHPGQISNVLRGLLGVRLVNFCPAMGCVDLVAMSSNMACSVPMAIIIDGQQQMPENVAPIGAPPVMAVLIDRLIAANDVMGIEVYARAGNMPLSLQVNDSRCGVIALWTGSRR
jgi:hypothetical protein